MATKRNAEREQEALQKLFEQRSYIGGRLPEILDPTPPDAPKELPSIVPTWDPVIPPEDGERPKRKARSEKVTGLHVILHSIQRDGFPHPVEQGSFLMLPKVFKAIVRTFMPVLRHRLPASGTGLPENSSPDSC